MEEEGFTVEADHRHAEITVDEHNFSKANGSRTPGTKDAKHADEEEVEMSREDARRFRGLAARWNFLAVDRGDIQYATKEACRAMAKPNLRSWEQLKRIARYLKQCPRAMRVFPCQHIPSKLSVTVDADHAGCFETRRSTSGGVVQLGTHTLKSWASTQAVVSLSSGESEFYSIVKGAPQGLGLKSTLRELGIGVDVEIYTDSSSAKGLQKSRAGESETHRGESIMGAIQSQRGGYPDSQDPWNRECSRHSYEVSCARGI